MKPRVPTPSNGSRAAALSSVPVPVINLQAKSQQALMSATAKQVAALQSTGDSLEAVLVVYSENHAASVFCEQGAPAPRTGGPK